MISWGDLPLGAVIPFPFTTYGKTNGESITLTGLAVTDIECFKGVSMTQRSSDAGYVLMDTDGIDIDGVTGFHGFSIDTGDNTDAGFFVAGSFFTVLVSAVTIDGQTVNFIAGTFRLVAAESVAGVPKGDTSHVSGTAQTANDIGADANDILARLSPLVTKTGAVVADGGNSATSFVTNLTDTDTDYWKDAFLRLTSGVLINQVKKITAYNGTTKAVTVLGGFTGTPATGVTFEIVND